MQTRHKDELELDSKELKQCWGQYLVPSLGKLADSAVDEIKKPQLTVPSEVREALPAVLRAQWRRFWITFTIIILNSFSGSLPISSSFIWTSVFLACCFVCVAFLCIFIIVFNLLCLRSLFHRLQG